MNYIVCRSSRNIFCYFIMQNSKVIGNICILFSYTCGGYIAIDHTADIFGDIEGHFDIRPRL